VVVAGFGVVVLVMRCLFAVVGRLVCVRFFVVVAVM